MSKPKKEWTEAHQREACARGHELQAEIIRGGAHLFYDAWRCMTEDGFRIDLSRAGFDPARIDREVARVRAIAEGRLVRETVWRVQFPSGHMTCPSLELARLQAKPNKWRRRCPVVRVTRIRRPR